VPRGVLVYCVCISEPQLFPEAAPIFVFITDGVFTARYGLNLYIWLLSLDRSITQESTVTVVP